MSEKIQQCLEIAEEQGALSKMALHFGMEHHVNDRLEPMGHSVTVNAEGKITGLKDVLPGDVQTVAVALDGRQSLDELNCYIGR